MSCILAKQLQEFVANLGVPFGCERSIKLQSNQCFDERFLLTLHLSTLTPSCRRKVLSWLLDRHFPAEQQGWFECSWRAAQLIHFGYEQQGVLTLLKVYFEYPEAMAVAESLPEPPFVFEAFKWSESGLAVFSHYRRKIFSTSAQLLTLIGADSAVLKPLLDRVFAVTPIDRVCVLEVTEPGNDRASFVINCYNAKLKVSQLQAELQRLCATFIDIEYKPLLQSRAEQLLGHVSIGTARTGEPFLALYFGAQAGSQS